MEQDYNLEKLKIEVENLFSNMTAKSGELEKRLLEIDKYFTNSKKLGKENSEQLKTLKRIFDSSTASIQKFRTDKKKIATLLKNTQNFYDKQFQPLKKLITDPDKGIAGTLKFTKAQQKEVVKIKVYCEDQYKKIKENVLLHDAALKKLTDVEKGIQGIFAEISIKGTESQRLIEQIAFTRRHADGLASTIEKTSKKSTDLKEVIEKSQSEAIAALGAIKDFFAKSEEAYQGILGIYEIAADTGRSGEFDRRRKALTFELNKWERSMRYVTIFLLIFIIICFVLQLWLYQWKIKEAGSDINFYVRFLLASPIVFYLSFSSIQYAKVRKLIDQYTFKTTLAVSIKSHLELLGNDDRFSEPKHVDEILKFTVEALQNIYKEPYNDDKMRISLKMKEIELKLGKDNLISSKIDALEEKFNIMVASAKNV